MMKTAEQYLKEKLNIEFPEGEEIEASWFRENHLPMIVMCEDCGTTMTLPSAYIDKRGYTFCASCAGHQTSTFYLAARDGLWRAAFSLFGGFA